MRKFSLLTCYTFVAHQLDSFVRGIIFVICLITKVILLRYLDL